MSIQRFQIHHKHSNIGINFSAIFVGDSTIFYNVDRPMLSLIVHSSLQQKERSVYKSTIVL